MNKNKFITALAIFSQGAILLIGPVLVLLFLGVWLDYIFKSTPILTLAGAFL